MHSIVKRALLCFLLVGNAAITVKAEDSRLGSKVDDFTLSDFLGKGHSLRDFEDSIVVVAFLGTECPLAKIYGAQLAALSEKYKDRGVVFLGINSNQQDTPTELGHYARQHKITFPLLKDPGNRVADQFKAKRTPEVFVLDRENVIRYQGRIDNQFGVGYARRGATRKHLAQAIEELASGKAVSVPFAKAVGCHIGRVVRTAPTGDITYTKDISRLFQKHCVQCHRDGGIAPFALRSYDDAAAWAETICEVVQEQRMPPWHASPKHGAFANDGRMTDEEKQLLYAWVENGVPQGDPSLLPPTREFVDGWALGKPDLVVKMPEPVTVTPTGVMDYQYVTIDPGFKEDKWVRASEIRPGVRSVVHHIIVFVDSPGADPILKEQGVGFESVGGFVPGSPPMQLPDGIARCVPAGSKFVLQIHYTPDGTQRHDQSEIGLYFADPGTIKKTMQSGVVFNLDFQIPPGAKDHRVEGSHQFSHDMMLHTLTPHMHYRGKSIRYELTYPNGLREILLDIPRYDFNWQNVYRFVEPKFVPEGSQLKCVAYFDNSEDNPANPDPTIAVRWGEQTWEEMMVGFFEAVFVNQDFAVPEPQITPTNDGRFKVQFQYKPDRPARTIHVAGTFNDWSQESHPMLDPDGDGIYTTHAVVDAGDYRYKMVVDGTYWSHDPASRSLTGYLHESYFVAGQAEATE
jgi:peroxiredoxin